MKFRIILFLLSLILAEFAFSQENSLIKSSGKSSKNDFREIPPDLRTRCSSFFETIITLDYDKAFTNLLKDSPLNKKTEQVKNLIEQSKRAVTMYGKLKNFEAVNAEFVTDSYIRVRYLALQTEYPLRWVFTFYKSPQYGWVVTNIKFDDLSESFFSDE
jgi:hypothetical protein